uniref:Uncharacterized protein n=1 Tax=Arundo donax TaxID=35708 RepID=A0A0A9B492_ARUDO
MCKDDTCHGNIYYVASSDSYILTMF